jgi:hypothetical protein
MILRIALDVRVGLGDLDGTEARGLNPRHHLGAAGERYRMAALGEDTCDSEARRQVPAAGPV